MQIVLGIPYAEAERWQAPAPVRDRPALGRFGPAAPQPTDGPLVHAVPGMGVQEQAEDCLTLNVWAPDGAAGLPVMVWVHGGAYVIGGSCLPTYDGARLAERGDVVVVSCNYRLGALANLLVPGAPANRGLRDLVAALGWVRDEIDRYGGDPGNVTLFGESAGAGSILHLLGVPEADGLYRRVVLQSPGAEVIRRPAAEALAEAFDAPLDAPADELVAAQDRAGQQVARLFGSMPWAPVVDGDHLPDAPQARIARGELTGVDVLVGATSTELAMFTRAMPDGVAPKVLRHLLTPILGRDPGREACERLAAAYGEDATAVLSDAAMGVPILRLTESLAAHHPGTYAYVFAWDGADFHAADLPFTFGTFDVAGWADFVRADDDARRLSDEMIQAWSAFAHHGDPGWPAFDAADRTTMVLGRTSRVTEHPLADRLALHEEV